MAGLVPAISLEMAECPNLNGMPGTRVYTWARRRDPSAGHDGGEESSDLHLLIRDHASGGRPLEQPILVRRVIFQLLHRQFAAHAPGVKHESVGIEHRIAVGQPFAA